MNDSRPESDHIQQIVLEIAPSVRKSMEHPGPKTKDFIVSACTEQNVRHSVESLRQRSRVLARLAESGKLLIAGAVYNLRSGKVDFIEGTGNVQAFRPNLRLQDPHPGKKLASPKP
jgi:carbonic anhydrase